MADRVAAPLIAGAFLRAVATGMAGVLLGVFLAGLGHGEVELGTISSLGLAGTALAATIATFRGEQIGRRRLLVLVTALAAGMGVLFAFGSSLIVLAAAAAIGMVNAAGRDRGAALVLEQSLLAQSVATDRRTMILARYNVAQDAGHALGALLAGLPALLEGPLGREPSLRAGMAAPALLLAIAAACAARISPAVDAARSRAVGSRLSPASRPRVARLCALFFADSFAGGLLTTAAVSWWFLHRFDVGIAELGVLNAAARTLNAVSHLAAAALARRIGLLNTMVFTHLPSSVLLIGAAFAPSFPVAATLFLLREGLVEMDVPTRQSYVLAVVRPEERTLVAGLTTLVRMLAWAIAPVLGGIAMAGVDLSAPLVAGAAIKIAYDLLLWRAFRHVVPPEERASDDRLGLPP